MTAHAPGPWTVTHWGINAAARAIVFDGTMHPEDARLISAAPDYAAGVELMLAHEDQGGDEWWRGWEMLKTAHAKAEGRL